MAEAMELVDDAAAARLFPCHRPSRDPRGDVGDSSRMEKRDRNSLSRGDIASDARTETVDHIDDDLR